VDASRARDLAAAAMTDDQARRVQEMLELQAGLRCNGCGRRITVGFKGISIDPRNPQQPVISHVACTREDCDHAEELARDSLAMEMIEYAWPQGGQDAPAAEMIVERNRRRQERKAQGGGS